MYRKYSAGYFSYLGIKMDKNILGAHANGTFSGHMPVAYRRLPFHLLYRSVFVIGEFGIFDAALTVNAV